MKNRGNDKKEEEGEEEEEVEGEESEEEEGEKEEREEGKWVWWWKIEGKLECAFSFSFSTLSHH